MAIKSFQHKGLERYFPTFAFDGADAVVVDYQDYH